MQGVLKHFTTFNQLFMNDMLDPMFKKAMNRYINVRQGYSLERKEKTELSRYLKPILSTNFVHASRLDFSNICITQFLMESLLIEKKKRNQELERRGKYYERLDYRFSDMNVSETIEHLTFKNCSFEKGVFKFLSLRLVNLKTLVWYNGYFTHVPFHEIYCLFNKTAKNKCKSLRYFFHDIHQIDKCVNWDKLSDEEVKDLTQKNLNIVEGEIEGVLPSFFSFSTKTRYSEEDIQDIIGSFPDHVVAIPIKRTRAFQNIIKKEGNYLADCVTLFGFQFESFTDSQWYY